MVHLLHKLDCRDILKKNGSAVEAAIATSLCDGITRIMSMGTGGGFLMTIYERKTKTASTLIARETAPLASTKDMFHKHDQESRIGARSAGVPGELKGYQVAYERFKSGNIAWKDLFEPAIKLCLEGLPITEFVAHNIVKYEKELRISESLSCKLLKDCGTIPVANEMFKMPTLAKTLTVIAESPKMADELYNGSLTESFVEDIKHAGGIITKEDLATYKAEWAPPLVANLKDGLTLHSIFPPSSGAILAFIMQILQTLVPADDGKDETSIQLLIETFKHAYGNRSHLGSMSPKVAEFLKKMLSPENINKVSNSIKKMSTTSNDFHYYGGEFSIKPDHGTGNVSVLAPNGDAVCVTSSINTIFGSFFMSRSTGILLNNHMDDFSSDSITNSYGLPPSPANFIAPRKRPMSSISPSVFTDKNGNVRLVIGSAGGTKITTSVAFVSMLNLWFGKSINDAINTPRVHHQLMPMELMHEYNFDGKVMDKMKQFGHKLQLIDYEDSSCVTAISQQNGEVVACSDFRWGGGSVAGF